MNQTTTEDDVEVKEMLKQRKAKGKINLAKELSDLVTYIQSVSFHSFDIVRRQGTTLSLSVLRDVVQGFCFIN